MAKATYKKGDKVTVLHFDERVNAVIVSGPHPLDKDTRDSYKEAYGIRPPANYYKCRVGREVPHVYPAYIRRGHQKGK